MKLSQRISHKAHHVMVYGGPFSGKTTIVGALAEKFNLLYFDLDNGIDTLSKLPEDWKERIEVISLPDTRSFPIAIETILKVIRGGSFDICEMHGKISCAVCKKESAPFVSIDLNSLTSEDIVVFDSVTQLTNSAIAHITKAQPEDYKLSYDDWGNLGKLMDIFFSHIQQAKFNVVCISHETEAAMEDGKKKLVPIGGTGNFSRNVAKYFDELVYCEVKNGKHKAASGSTYSSNILTGSRNGILLEKQDTPSLLPIFTGEVITQHAVIQSNSPGQIAQSSLSKLQAALKKA